MHEGATARNKSWHRCGKRENPTRDRKEKKLSICPPVAGDYSGQVEKCRLIVKEQSRRCVPGIKVGVFDPGSRAGTDGVDSSKHSAPNSPLFSPAPAARIEDYISNSATNLIWIYVL